MQKKRVTKIVDSINKLNTKDTYSLMLFVLYNMHDIPEYSTLSELCYILDNNNLTKLLSYYGGMTIKIPTLRDMRLLVKTLTLYQYVNVEAQDFEQALNAVVETSDFTAEEIKKTYGYILDVTSKYDFGDNETVGESQDVEK